MAKRVLKQDNDYRFEALGIVSPLKDYRLCWFFNQALQTDLHRVEDIEFHAPKERRVNAFSHFTFFREIDDVHYHVVENKGSSGVFLPKAAQFDFLLILEGSLAGELIEETEAALRLLDALQLVRPIDKQLFNGLENLIFD